MTAQLLAKLVWLTLKLLTLVVRQQTREREKKNWAQKLQARLKKIESRVRTDAGHKSGKLREPDTFQRHDDE